MWRKATGNHNHNWRGSGYNDNIYVWQPYARLASKLTTLIGTLWPRQWRPYCNLFLNIGNTLTLEFLLFHLLKTWMQPVIPSYLIIRQLDTIQIKGNYSADCMQFICENCSMEISQCLLYMKMHNQWRIEDASKFSTMIKVKSYILAPYIIIEVLLNINIAWIK